MDELLEVLESVKPDVDFSNETELVDGGILNSFDLVMIVGELQDHYDIAVPADEILPEHFNSAEAILDLIEDIQDRI
jgi:acyl carrier protein